MMRKGVTASLTELLMVVVAFAMVFAFSAFVIGNVHGLSGTTHRLQVYGDAKLVIDQNNGKVYALVRLYSDMKPEVVITEMVVDKYVSTNVSIVEVLQGNPRVEDGKLVLPVGSYVVVRFDFPPEAAQDIRAHYWGVVEGQLITEQGFLYKVELKIEYAQP